MPHRIFLFQGLSSFTGRLSTAHQCSPPITSRVAKLRFNLPARQFTPPPHLSRPSSLPVRTIAYLSMHAIRPSYYGGGHPAHPHPAINRLNNHRANPTLPPPPDFASGSQRFLLLSPTLDFLLIPTPNPTLLHPLSTLLPHLPDPPPPSHFLGLHPTHQFPVYSLSLPSNSQPSSVLSFRSLRHTFHLIPPLEANFAAHARSLAEFHNRHQFCGLCGAPTVPDHHGSRRRCSRNTEAKEPHHITPASLGADSRSCPGVWFPRVDPVVIMLVVSRDSRRALLARQARFPKGMYSCLAGFMEHAEGVDDAVRRETWEETGVRVGEVRFFGSQPWPFPFSLMLGCVGVAMEEDLNVDETELESAIWFGREEVEGMVKNAGKAFGRERKDQGAEEALFVPPSSALGGELCLAFARGDAVTVFEGGGKI